jgi:hypothetical protein
LSDSSVMKADDRKVKSTRLGQAPRCWSTSTNKMVISSSQYPWRSMNYDPLVGTRIAPPPPKQKTLLYGGHIACRLPKCPRRVLGFWASRSRTTPENRMNSDSAFRATSQLEFARILITTRRRVCRSVLSLMTSRPSSPGLRHIGWPP